MKTTVSLTKKTSTAEDGTIHVAMFFPQDDNDRTSSI